ncbi:Hypothetical protein HDN1F_31550 [gamma proteobacterium HdN1]|nr:Hypothetical protein HDN1F_31550 [gamma proteobacterium HdN1]
MSASQAKKIELCLYHTDHCHLCEQAEALCTAVLNPEFFALELCDIALQDVLMERYGVRIPVLQVKASGEELGWPFDAEGLMAFLAPAAESLF